MGNTTSISLNILLAKILTKQCLREPQAAFYGGGIIVNPEFDHGIEGWKVFGQGKIEGRLAKEGNRFIVAHNRTHPLDSFSQKVQVDQGKIYSFSAWVQVSEGSEIVAVVFRPTKGDLTHGGKVIARSGCWSLLKGGMVANFSSPIEIFFECKNTSAEIWADNVSLQPFTKKQWRSHQDQSISKIRKSNIRFQVTSADKTPLEDAQVSIKQTKSDFPFGCGMNYHILQSTDYQNWFSSRFKATTFTNEMKWYSTEKGQGEENYTIADAMMEFAQSNGIRVRGHNVFWDNPKYQPSWVKSLSTDELRSAAAKRISSVVSRYSGKLIGWDVVNENLHFSFFEDKLSQNASAEFYHIAQQLDPNTTMFLNEYNTIEYSDDEASSPLNYHKKLVEILSFPGNAQYLEEILREGYSHPAVQGIIMFAGPELAGFNVTTLADINFENTPAGYVVDELIQEWNSGTLETRTDNKGFIDLSLFHGDYGVTVKHPLTNSSATMSLRGVSYVEFGNEFEKYGQQLERKKRSQVLLSSFLEWSKRVRFTRSEHPTFDPFRHPYEKDQQTFWRWFNGDTKGRLIIRCGLALQNRHFFEIMLRNGAYINSESEPASDGQLAFRITIEPSPKGLLVLFIRIPEWVKNRMF
ncbi:putative endo-1,4-beta-xylanase C [Morus notabilis]|uniref:Putative endo-1,4-beta-xylanase C n=1 Tax=Morus notabilis TaxID=981085 RepID=W9SDX1_9ROSA|nr:putative endo-1,4-beta-xylanase C [Morus notabilis]